MRIRFIELNNFKRFDKLEIDLGESPKKVIALVGPNGSGKSSVFDAFEEKQKIYKSAHFNPIASFFHKLMHSGIPDVQPYDRNHAIKIIRDDNTETFDKKSFYIRTSYRFTPSINVTAIQKQSDILDDVARPGSSAQLDARLTENYERLLGRAFEEWQEGDVSGKKFREELLGRINVILEKVLDIRITSLGNVVEGRGQLYFEKGKSKNFPYDNLSSGEKEVVDLILDLVVKREQFTDTVFCIDEPELHLNTAIQRKLLIEIEKLIPDSCQLWIATHSIGFLRALQEELKDKVSVLDFSGKDFDAPARLVPMKLTRQNWQLIFQTALEDLTGLLSPRRIIYCEGRKEPDSGGSECGLDANVYNEIFSEEYPEVLFVSSGGNLELERNSSIALTILNKAFTEVGILILKDKDINADGAPTTDEQRAEWLAGDKGRRMLERKEIENYLFDHSVLSKKYPDISIEDMNRIVTDVINGDVKNKTGEIMRICRVLTGVNQVQFKLGLAEEIVQEMEIYKELKRCIFPGEV